MGKCVCRRDRERSGDYMERGCVWSEPRGDRKRARHYGKEIVIEEEQRLMCVHQCVLDSAVLHLG